MISGFRILPLHLQEEDFHSERSYGHPQSMETIAIATHVFACCLLEMYANKNISTIYHVVRSDETNEWFVYAMVRSCNKIYHAAI